MAVRASLIGALVFMGAALSARAAQVDGCVEPAAAYHQVNPSILRAILGVESSMRPGAVNRNPNGTLDLGIGQINTIHLRELGKFGIGPKHLLDACIGTYVAAWHLAKQYKTYGNTWYAIGAYHSTSAIYNQRYQQLVFNKLVDMGVYAGPKRYVPPLPRNGGNLDVAAGRAGAQAKDRLIVLSE